MLALLVSYTLVFGLLHLSGGDPLASDLPLSAQARAQLAKQLFLDQPLSIQYLMFLKNSVTLQWGNSFVNSLTPLNQLLPRAFATSAVLGILAFCLALPTAILLALAAFFHRVKLIRSVLVGVILLLGSLPSLISAPFLFLVIIQLFPHLYANQMAWYHPAWLGLLSGLLALPSCATFAKILYSHLQFHQHHHYLSQLLALGFSLPKALWQLRTSLLLPLNAYAPTAFAQLLSGSILMEQFFRIPGLGQLSVTAIVGRDYPVILLCSLLFSLTLWLLSSLSLWVNQQLEPRLQGVST
jgi:ABC-type dipeptide/oligopeptide/nickel transport system permease component